MRVKYIDVKISYFRADVPNDQIAIVTSRGEHRLAGMWRQRPQLTFAMAEDQRTDLTRFVVDFFDVGRLQTDENLSLDERDRRRSDWIDRLT